MLETIAIVIVAIAALAGVLIAFAATKPDTFRVERSTDVAAPAERIYPLIADLKAMNTWNPFVKPDPAIRLHYTGPEIGKGASNTWSGNRHVGEGSIEIVDAVAPSRVAMKLNMLKPMSARNDVEFTLQPNGNGTTVTWAMSGAQPLIGKLMNVFINCDRMVGSQFEKGLASLKSIAEQR